MSPPFLAPAPLAQVRPSQAAGRSCPLALRPFGEVPETAAAARPAPRLPGGAPNSRGSQSPSKVGPSWPCPGRRRPVAFHFNFCSRSIHISKKKNKKKKQSKKKKKNLLYESEQRALFLHKHPVPLPDPWRPPNVSAVNTHRHLGSTEVGWRKRGIGSLFRLKPAPLPQPPSPSSTAAPRTTPLNLLPPAPRAWTPFCLTDRLTALCCALCRLPWPEQEDAALSHACNELGVNPFQDSEAEPPAPASTIAGADPPWRRREPPSHPIDSAHNSWLYCPLLHAATGEMPDSVVALWHAAAAWWTPARHRLAAAPPISALELHTALLDSTSAGAPTLAARLAAATQPLPRGTELHLGWVVRTLYRTPTAIYPPPARKFYSNSTEASALRQNWRRRRTLFAMPTSHLLAAPGHPAAAAAGEALPQAGFPPQRRRLPRLPQQPCLTLHLPRSPPQQPSRQGSPAWTPLTSSWHSTEGSTRSNTRRGPCKGYLPSPSEKAFKHCSAANLTASSANVAGNFFSSRHVCSFTAPAEMPLSPPQTSGVARLVSRPAAGSSSSTRQPKRPQCQYKPPPCRQTSPSPALQPGAPGRLHWLSRASCPQPATPSLPTHWPTARLPPCTPCRIAQHSPSTPSPLHT